MAPVAPPWLRAWTIDKHSNSILDKSVMLAWPGIQLFRVGTYVSIKLLLSLYTAYCRSCQHSRDQIKYSLVFETNKLNIIF